METEIKKGGISVQTEHIFPVIKKWLYSEKEIFLREIVSNSCDAITKLKRLMSLGEVHDIEDSSFKIKVNFSKKNKTITVSDNGIGMTEEELDKYLCSIALSGALDFIQKYENEDSNGNGIIGHFGLGFYSAFMVADTVDVITRSYTGADSVKWVCNEDGSYELMKGNREERGTDVVMHLTESEAESMTSDKIREILTKYCSFMPVEIYFTTDESCEHCEDCKDHEHEHEETPINDTHPLWQKNPSECTKEEYDKFYSKLFFDYKEPLFAIHINADYPLNFKGILYFPKINSEYESLEGQIKLYYNQVFVSDNIKDIIPDYLLMLKGVLDCPELPLNVSRSYLQNNTYVSKVSAHIVKKIADKLNSLYNTEREYYEKIWEDLKIFVEYGSLKDKKFFDKVKPAILFKTCDDKCLTVDEYLEKHKDICEKTVYYTNDKKAQSRYIELYKAQGIDVVVLDRVLDAQFITLLEQDKEIKFYRVDSDIAPSLKGEESVCDCEKLKESFKAVSGDEKLTVKAEHLKDSEIPAILNIAEDSRRFSDVMKMYAPGGENTMPQERSLVLNFGCPLIAKLNELCEKGEDTSLEIKQIYNLALLSGNGLDAEHMKSFISNSVSIIEKAINKGE